ncbi:MAG: amino acid adenylation domain-containing protein [Verrucomicrobia bacterium]|nr:amino acid adenylation domain-containing protein [Verrucomicrobiota bacterium]MDA1087334.1 amino acid adenylation domain-containing protein [Verrucomicrobiota bacterium]
MSASSADVEERAVSALTERLAGLPTWQLAAVQARLLERKRSELESICAYPVGSIHPQSYHQRRLWFIEQFQPGTPNYNVCRAIRVRGMLNRPALESALQSLVERHEALRTTFELQSGEPVQRINPPSELPLPEFDLCRDNTCGTDVEAVLQRRLTAEARRTFDLSKDLVWRVAVYRLADDEHVLQITIHHLACDGCSLRILFDELALLYGGRAAFPDPALWPLTDALLPPVRLQYSDFARWQREPRQTASLQPQIEWWTRQIAGAPTALDLATDHPRPQLESGRGRIEPFAVPGELREQLGLLGREEGATLFMSLLTGFFILVHRYTGLQDFLVGSATAGRPRPEMQKIVGFFADTVLLRADVSGQPTVRELLRRVRSTVIDAMNHSDVPFERLVDSVKAQRDLSRNALFQVLFNAPPQYVPELCGLDVSPICMDPQTSRFDLEWTYSDGANRTTGVTYNADLYDASTIRRMCEHYLVLLQAIVANPDQRIRDLPVLTDSERIEFHRWNDTKADYPAMLHLHELFEAQVSRNPDAVALAFESTRLTYRGLDQRARDFAHTLREALVGPSSDDARATPVVAVCLERSPELVTAIIGILKAGAAWLPIDVDAPQTRRDLIIAESQASLLVERDPATEQVVLRSLEIPTDSDSQTRAPEDTAYVIYTSGSSGVPKGVVIPHSAVVNLLTGMQSLLGLAPGDRFLGVASPTFDIFVAELFLPLVSGGTAVLVSPDVARSPADLCRAIVDHDPAWIQATPATWRMLCEHGWQGATSATLISTGEALPAALAAQLIGRGNGLWDLYGPTETTIWSTAHRVDAAAGAGCIGRPIANTQVYVLDHDRQPVPIGVYGELYIGGDGLAAGYLNRADLTAERFVPNPFGSASERRLYRTGDEVRWRSDGTLQYRGRLDQQVKLRGYRIELGEIESVLSRHPGVGQCAVLLREDSPEDPRLCAYVSVSGETLVGDGGAVDVETVSALLVDGIRTHLRSHLPSYMMPSAIEILDEFPLSTRGKIDRNALPAPGHDEGLTAHAMASPRNDVEEKLAGIWQEVLGVERVGIHDNFFDLGGHSLLVARMIDMVNREFGGSRNIAAVFRTPTIAGLAGCLDSSDASRPGPPAEAHAGHFLSVLQEGAGGATLICVGGKVTKAALRIPEEVTVLTLGYDGVQSQPFLGLSIAELARRYADEVLQAQPCGRVVIVGFCYAGLLAYALAHGLRDRGTLNFELVLLEPTTPSMLALTDANAATPHEDESSGSRLRSLWFRLRGALRFRASRIWTGLQMAARRPVSLDRRWNYYFGRMLRNALTYQPPTPLPGSVHLICGRSWIRRNGTIWTETYLQDPPTVVDLADASHMDLTDLDAPADTWIRLVRDLCA